MSSPCMRFIIVSRRHPFHLYIVRCPALSFYLVFFYLLSSYPTHSIHFPILLGIILPTIHHSFYYCSLDSHPRLVAGHELTSC
ncbi:hypothetical protein F5B19DRAFT_217906 [Rostrohypoxylon terebratum]|nr:hypothetical protein F5B19DRAFT_217906 [Rostrohypoxylon terebratum]